MSIADSVDSIAVRVTVTSSSVAPPSEPTSTAVASAAGPEDEEDEAPPKAKKRKTALDASSRLQSGSSFVTQGQRHSVRDTRPQVPLSVPLSYASLPNTDEDTATPPPAPQKARKSARQAATAATATQPTSIESNNGLAGAGELSPASAAGADAPFGSGTFMQAPVDVPARKKRKTDTIVDAGPSAYRQTPHIDLAAVSLYSVLIHAQTWRA